MVETEYMTTDDVSKVTHTPVETLRYWRYLGRGPKSFRVGRRVLYRADDVRAWLDAARESGDAA